MERGKKVGRWTLEKETVSKDRRRSWECLCICGNKKIVPERYLEKGRSLSCGCGRRLKDGEEIIGQKIGEYTITGMCRGSSNRRKYLVRCSCGTEKELRIDTLNDLKEKHCGCLSEPAKGSDPSYKALYFSWYDMIRRCNSLEREAYKNYGGRGIKVCQEWKDSFETFLKWSREQGFEHGLTLDRINNDGDYEPCNCRWVTIKENSRNSRNTKLTLSEVEEIRASHEKYTEISTKYGISLAQISRIKNNTRWT